jgi:hypothetical protein
MVSLKRCRWCGQFVLADTEPTTRTILGGQPDAQWRRVQQTLCPECSRQWSRDEPWNKEADLTLPLEVLPDMEAR